MPSAAPAWQPPSPTAPGERGEGQAAGLRRDRAAKRHPRTRAGRPADQRVGRNPSLQEREQLPVGGADAVIDVERGAIGVQRRSCRQRDRRRHGERHHQQQADHQRPERGEAALQRRQFGRIRGEAGRGHGLLEVSRHGLAIRPLPHPHLGKHRKRKVQLLRRRPEPAGQQLPHLVLRDPDDFLHARRSAQQGFGPGRVRRRSRHLERPEIASGRAHVPD
jgi:hypothetical protein